MTEDDRQDSFDGAVKLLLEVFPDRGNLVSSDHRWEEGDKYLGLIASLARSWNESQDKPEPLEPTTDLCNLMANASWLVADNDTAGILSLVTHTAEAAYQKLPEAENDPILWADILNLLGILYLMEGDFKTAEDVQTKSLAIRRELKSPEDLSINACYNYLGVVLDSDLRHDEAKEWLAKSAEILEKGDGDLYIRLRCQNKLNTSRNRYVTENFDESEKLVDAALVLATDFNSWYSLAYVHETYASLYSRSGDLARARTHVVQAEEVLTHEGSFVKMSWISGLCSFRAASVAILQDRTQYAIEEAERSVAINKLYKAPVGVRARSHHLLSKALAKDPDRRAESEEARREAQRLRSLLPKGRTNLGDESDMAFERLVTMIQR